MIANDTIVKVTNRSDSMLGYQIPELHIKRRYAPNETKPISAAELRALYARKGGKSLIKNHLVIDNEQLVNELVYNVQPEYYYTPADVKTLLLYGSEDQLLDALDFAPSGVIDLIKAEAVKLQLNDVRKRNIILDKTGFNITKAIEANAESAKVEAAPATRRAAPVNATAATEAESTTEAPQRRTTTLSSKYNVVVK